MEEAREEAGRDTVPSRTDVEASGEPCRVAPASPHRQDRAPDSSGGRRLSSGHA